MKLLHVIAGVGVFCGSYVAGTRDWGGHAPRPQPPPGEVVAQQEPRNPPAPPRPAPAGVGIEIVNHADCDISFLVDPEFQTLALFTYLRYRTPTLAPGDQQPFEVPPGGYQVLVDGCPRGDLVALTPDRPFFLEFVTESPGTPPLARVIAADRMVFQTALRSEPPPPVVYVCPSHPGVRFLTPCACPVCHIEVVVIRPAVVYACPVHPAVVLTGPGGCSQCSAPLVIQMQFHLGGGGEEAQTDPLGPAGHTHADEQGQVQHEEAPAPEQQQPPKEEPKQPPKEEPKKPPEEEPKKPPEEEPEGVTAYA